MTATDVPQLITDAISEAMKVDSARLAGAKMVEVAPERRNHRGWPFHIVAARLEGLEFTGTEIGIWATGSGPEANQIGPIHALNDVAREYSDWGEAAKPGSKADQMMDALAQIPEAREAEQAVTAG